MSRRSETERPDTNLPSSASYMEGMEEVVEGRDHLTGNLHQKTSARRLNGLSEICV